MPPEETEPEIHVGKIVGWVLAEDDTGLTFHVTAADADPSSASELQVGVGVHFEVEDELPKNIKVVF